MNGFDPQYAYSTAANITILPRRPCKQRLCKQTTSSQPTLKRLTQIQLIRSSRANPKPHTDEHRASRTLDA